MNQRQFASRIILYLLLITATAGCAEQVTGPQAWIDAPVDGSNVPVGNPVPIIAHVYAPEGVAEVLLSVNGTAHRRNPPARPGDPFTDAALEWSPQQEGDYVLQVTAYSRSGEAIHARSVSIRAIGTGTVTPVRVTPVAITPAAITPVSRASDLEIVSVDTVVVGYKGDTPFCDIRVVYRNAGTVPVPSDYVIQAYLDGRPHASVNRGAGFGVGGTSEAIIVYQFVGLAYIGINLDSTNAVAEINETNNSFSESRICGGVLPVITLILTATPARTPTIGIPLPPVTLTPTRTPTIGIAPPPTLTLTPTPTRTRTRTPTPHDTTPPPIPNPLDPTGGESVPCSGATGTATLRWSSVSDPSGGIHYYIKWDGAGQSGGWDGTGTQHSISIKCGFQYTWRVRASDGAGNLSDWSAPATFLAGTLQ